MNDTFHHLHFVGIKGVQLSALALIAKQKGYQVSGSDVAEQFITDASLREAGISAQIGFAAEHVGSDVDLLVVGAAYGADNPEVQTAHDRQLTIWTASELLAHFASQQKTLAVAGTHGKTTTTSVLTYLLYAAGLKPSWLIGTGEVSGLPAHGGTGEGDYFIAEADDYKKAPDDPQPKFLDLTPYGAIIGSIEHDHPDMYPTLQDCIEAFYQLAVRVQPDGFLVVNGDDPQVAQVRSRLIDKRFITFGKGEDVTYRIVNDQAIEQGLIFQLEHDGRLIGPFTTQLHGQHNLLNVTAAVVMALQVGVEPATIAALLPNFTTVERRYQVVGRVGEQVIIDDYAHHPTSVALTLQTARQHYAGRPIWCFFQAHTYSRTKALLKEFGEAFAEADMVVVTDIFASAREKEVVITTKDLVEEIRKHHPNVVYVPQNELGDYMRQNLPANAVAITMGAGDIYKIGHEYVGATQ